MYYASVILLFGSFVDEYYQWYQHKRNNDNTCKRYYNKNIGIPFNK